MKHLRHQRHEEEVYEGNSGLMLGSLSAYGGDIKSPWPTLGSLWEQFKDTLGAFGDHCGRMKVALGPFGVTLSSLWVQF